MHLSLEDLSHFNTLGITNCHGLVSLKATNVIHPLSEKATASLVMILGMTYEESVPKFGFPPLVMVPLPLQPGKSSSSKRPPRPKSFLVLAGIPPIIYLGRGFWHLACKALREEIPKCDAGD